MTIKHGTIGVNTASDTGQLLEVKIGGDDVLWCEEVGAAAGDTGEWVPAADFWPLLAGLSNPAE